MISFFTCTGYKYFSTEPPLSFLNRHGFDEFRDNMLYVSVSFSDWKQDQEMLRFVLDTHFKGFDSKFMAKAIKPFVQNNQTSQLHQLIWQHSTHPGRAKAEHRNRSAHCGAVWPGGSHCPAVHRTAPGLLRGRVRTLRCRGENESKRWEQLEQERAERRRKREGKTAGTKSPK